MQMTHIHGITAERRRHLQRLETSYKGLAMLLVGYFNQSSSWNLYLLLSSWTVARVSAAALPNDWQNAPWMSTADGSGAQILLPDDDENENPALAHARRRFLAGSTSGYENEFIDGSESYYNDYAQAWRLLGFYTDCQAPHNNYNECNDNNNNRDEDEDPACQRCT